MLTRREAVKGIGAAMAGLLIPQDYQMPGDLKGKRKKVRPEDIRSGTLYGQYQLRGSILTIKDASTTASGFMAFGTDMTTIPGSSVTGTGIYIDYTGIYGLAAGVQQAYMQASTGKIVAGAGAVVLDDDGISIVSPASKTDINSYKFTNGGATVAAWSHYLGASPDVSTSTLEVNSQTNRDLFSYITTPQPSATYESSIKLDAYTTHIHAIYDDSATPKGYVRMYGGTTFAVVIGDGSTSVPASTLHLKNSAPSFRMEDSTISAKSLLVTVDANYATFEEVGGNDLLKLDLANLSVILGNAALATTATDGFLYIPACAGAPTGVPTAVTGRIPLVVDSTNSKMYIYSGGAWVALN